MHKYIIIWPHVDNHSLLQRRTVAKRNFPQDTSDSVNCLWGVQRWRRQVWSNVFVCLSFKINVSLEDWQNCHAVTLFPYFCFLLQIWCLTWEYIVISWKVDAGNLCPSVPLGGESNYGFPDNVPFIAYSNHQINSSESWAIKCALLTFLWVFCMSRLGLLKIQTTLGYSSVTAINFKNSTWTWSVWQLPSFNRHRSFVSFHQLFKKHLWFIGT